MDNWYSLNLGDGIMATQPSDEIREQFLRSFLDAGNPPDMAVFTRLESEGRLHDPGTSERCPNGTKQSRKTGSFFPEIHWNGHSSDNDR